MLKSGIKPQTLSDMMKAETKTKIIIAVENPPDARKGGGGQAKVYTMRTRGRGAYTWKYVRKNVPFARVL